jgi:4-hydroxybenzoate polyprenyltransferase
MLRGLRHILEMIRFSHTLFALPFALLAAVMAWTAGARSQPPIAWRWQELVGIVLCMVTARSAAMAFNRIADWRLDAANPRTRARHIPAGTLSVASVVAFAIATSVAFVGCTLLFWPNRLPTYLALPVLAFLLAYSYTKRFTAAAHFWLGAALMLAPVSAWIAIRGEQVLADPADLLPAVVLGAAVLLWVAGFDIIYACQDVDFDRTAGLRSVPARLGVPRALQWAAACHLGMVVMLLALAWVFPPLGWIYAAGVAAVAALLLYEHWLVRPDDLDRVNLAFFQVNAVVSIGLFLVASLDLLTSAPVVR